MKKTFKEFLGNSPQVNYDLDVRFEDLPLQSKQAFPKDKKKKMKRIFFILILGIVLLHFISAVPRIEPYVNDYANLFTSEQISSLNLYLDRIEQDTSWEIALVTLQNTEGQDRLEYANKIGDENGVGKLDKDNGIVVLYSLDNEKGGAIATGRYSESIFNDAKTGRIGREAQSLCDEEKYYECFDFIVKELEKEIKNESLEVKTNPKENDIHIWAWFLIIGICLILLIIFLNNSSGYSSGSSGRNSFGSGSFGGGGSKF